MKRNINTLISAYHKQFTSKGEDFFFVSDFQQLFEHAKQETSCSEALFRLASEALNAGFMVGYNYAGRQEAKKRAAIRQAATSADGGTE